jgi:hypothetical protein
MANVYEIFDMYSENIKIVPATAENRNNRVVVDIVRLFV